jgi:dihydroxy-acid dehydratase
MPALSLAEPFQKPTTMLYRNLLAMEAEELLRSYPADGCVLMGGCDKTTPGLVMGALSMNLPTIFLPAGPMLRGDYKGKFLGSGSDTWKYWAELRAGNITEDDWRDVEDGIARSPGHCMTMGTASTMTSATEAMGLTLSGAASIPRPIRATRRWPRAWGKRIVEMVWEDLCILDIVDARAIDNAVTTVLSMGGSTNAIVHLIATARRAGCRARSSSASTRLRARTPVLANIRPSGKYLMEDFLLRGWPAGADGAARRPARPLCAHGQRQDARRGHRGAEIYNDDVIRPRSNPLLQNDGLAVLRGNLAPDGAVIKPAAMEPHLLRHTGRAIVFRNYNDMNARIDDPALDVDKDSVLVLQSAGPQGAPGLPEWGQLPIPKKLLQQGVRDMVRISDARMSGTSYGACVLHVAPESHVGGPLALVNNGDLIELDVPGRKLTLKVDDAELARRREAWVQPPPHYTRGFGVLYLKHVTQADVGCDFDFLESGKAMSEPEIH